MEKETALRQLDEVADTLARDGNEQLAKLTRDSVAALRRDEYSHSEVVSTTEAAELLGVRNVGMIGRWEREGRLEGCRVGGRLGVSRRSVERMVESPIVANERAFERNMDEVLAAFDFGDEELPPSDASSRGRAPWDDIASRRP